ncbi:MAG: rRNA pseudouridine synthase [Oscillospiraceae bacterium]|jgi:23S rRNA pseudouridine2605 synthase|nr:rRNA pseudouridine synthase [Oscillospiraceae bacterium]
MPKERLQKILSAAGLLSRRAAEVAIRAGRVQVNGRPVSLGDSADPAEDNITLDGAAVRTAGQKRYIALHKPRGVVCTLADERGRRCLPDLLVDVPERVYPIGRLDRDSEGLVLLTNDGAFANDVMHPRAHIGKTYRVTVAPALTEDQLAEFSSGMRLDDGQTTAPARITTIDERDGRQVLEIVLWEGRNRQIRRMLEAFSVQTLRLKRKQIGGVKLGMLSSGRWRDLTPKEMQAFRR